MNIMSNINGSNTPIAAKAPAAKISEWPGRNGNTTRPVSQNTMTNKIKYVQKPY